MRKPKDPRDLRVKYVLGWKRREKKIQNLIFIFFQTTSKMLNLLIGNQKHALKRVCNSYYVLNLYRPPKTESHL